MKLRKLLIRGFGVVFVVMLLFIASHAAASETPPPALIISAVAWSPDGSMIAASGGTTVQILDTTTMRPLNTLTGFQEQMTAPSWSPDGRQLAIANGPEVQIWQQPWDSSAAQLVATFETASYIMSLAWSPSGDKIAVAQDALEVWEASTAQLLHRKYEHDNFVPQVAWSPDGTLLATASTDDTVKIWDAMAGTVSSTMTTITNSSVMPASEIFQSALSVSWNPDGTKLVFGAADGTVRIWDRNVLSGAEVATGWGEPEVIHAHEDAVWAVSWSPVGTLIASGSLDGTVRIWDATTGGELQVIQVGTPVRSVALSPDGSRLAYIGANGALQIVTTPPQP